MNKLMIIAVVYATLKAGAKRKPEKKFRLERDSNPRPLRYNTILARLVTPHRGFSGLIYKTVWGTLAILLVTQFTINFFRK